MTRRSCLWTCVLGAAMSAWLSAADGSPSLARDLLTASSSTMLTVTSDAFQPGQPLPVPYSQEGENFSPGLAWQGAPAGTRSFVLMMEDPDAREPKPYVHWTMYDLPPDVTRLHESMPAMPQLPPLGHSKQGRTSRGTVGYVGPRPPKSDPPHHYHFQVFALDAMLSLPPAADRAALLGAMKGHVLASGETVATFQRR